MSFCPVRKFLDIGEQSWKGFTSLQLYIEMAG